MKKSWVLLTWLLLLLRGSKSLTKYRRVKFNIYSWSRCLSPQFRWWGAATRCASPSMREGRVESPTGFIRWTASFNSDDTFDDTTHSSSCWQEKGTLPTRRFYSMPLTIDGQLKNNKLPQFVSPSFLPLHRLCFKCCHQTDKISQSKLSFYPTAIAYVNAMKNNPERSTCYSKPIVLITNCTWL